MTDDIEIRPCGEGKSFFDFMSDYWKARKGNDRAFHRICSLMRKMDAQNIVIEKYGNFSDKEVEEEKGKLQNAFKTKMQFDIFRFTFLRKEIDRLDEICTLEQHNFLGNAILVNLQRPEGFWTSYILRSIITFPNKDGSSGLLNNYLHVINDFDLKVGIGEKKFHEYVIKGTYFSQQNGITSVCAHSCLKMLINNNKKTEDELLTTEDINKKLGLTPEKLAKEPPSIKNIIDILTDAKMNIIPLDCFKYPNSDYADFVYKLIESRFPTLLIFITKPTEPYKPPESHVIYVFGHTLNTDIWKTQAEFGYSPTLLPVASSPSSSYVDHFIIHDDNLGMYLTLQVDALRKVTLPYKDPYFRALYVLGITTEKIELNSNWAEGAAVIILNILLELYTNGNLTKDSNKWLDRLADNNNRPWITRIVLTDRASYGDYLNSFKDFLDIPFNKDNEEEVNLITKELPEKFWLIEISLPDLYATNKTKLVDIIYSVTDISDVDEKLPEDEIIRRRTFDNCILIRLPGILVFLNKTTESKGKDTIIKDAFPLGVKEHYPLFRYKSDIVVPEW